jgi:hypothetical protein
MPHEDDDSFLARWSRRKALAQRGEGVGDRDLGPPTAPPAASKPSTAPAVPAPPSVAGPAPIAQRTDTAAPATTPAATPPKSRPAATPPPTLDDVAKLTRDADFSRFVARDVEAPVRHAALKKLFSDPRFNVMDGLDTYIDDYGRPDPLPASMLRRMVQARGLGLFQDETPADRQLPSSPAVSGTGTPVPGQAPDRSVPAEPGTITADANDAPAGPPHPADADKPAPPPDEDPDLQLQPHDAAGPAGDRRRAGQDPRRLD